jgi:hypothetical protein
MQYPGAIYHPPLLKLRRDKRDESRGPTGANLHGEIPHDSPVGRQRFAACVEVRRHEAAGEEVSLIEHGWCMGSDAFRQELLAQVDRLAMPTHCDPEVRESGLAKAERLWAQELDKRGWSVAHLQGRRKGDPHTIDIAARLRRETTLTLAWIAERLHMGVASHVAGLLYRKEKKNDESENTLF